MTKKLSVKAAARDALREDKAVRKVRLLPDGTQTRAASLDSFVNFAHNMGIGADNPTTTASYGFNPITRNRILLEWIHRGSWLGGLAIDVMADDMTRAGVEFKTELPPHDSEAIDFAITGLEVWDRINDTIKWARLYGGAIAVALIDGQDPRTPLNLNAIAPGSFKGLLVLDRWMVEPSLEDLVTDYGPHLGLPRYYRVSDNAPALRNQPIHHSRVMFRLEGVPLPYQQRLTENLWGISVLERLYDRMVAFDSASTGAAQLVYKAYLRTLKVDGLRDIVAAGGAPMKGLYSYVEVMRRFQSMEGITMLDKDDDFEVQTHGAFSGLADALVQFGQQVSGALQIPLVRLFGQSPSGLNSTGESDMRLYYDHILQQQRRHLGSGINLLYRVLAKSKGIEVPDTMSIDFKPLWQLSDTEKSEIASKDAATVSGAMDSGIIGRRTALSELRQSSKVTGVFTNITDDMIAAADDEVQPPGIEGMGGLPGLPGLPGISDDDPLNEGEPNAQPTGLPGGNADGPRRRVKLLQPPAPGGKADQEPDPSPGQ